MWEGGWFGEVDEGVYAESGLLEERVGAYDRVSLGM